MRRPKFHILAILLAIYQSCLVYAEEEYSETYRESVFHVGATLSQYALTGKNNLKLIGNSGVINLGGGFLSESYFSLSSLNIILGPYQPLNDVDSRLDYSGTGFSTTLGWTWSSAGLRNTGGSFGISAGVHYVDIVGRSVGTRTLDTGTIRDQVNQIYDFSFLPGFFYANLKSPRRKGNDPELLTTRLEGLVIMLGIGFPIKSDYKQEYIQTSSGTGETKVKSKGELEGRSYIITLITPLGV